MRVIHNIMFNRSEPIADDLDAAGIRYDVRDSLCFLHVYEDDPIWLSVKRMLEEYTDIPHTSGVVFSYQERLNAEYLWLSIPISWRQGYPQPEDTYEEVTYDLSDHCPRCGIGREQIRPIRMKSEPKWEGKHLLQLNWIDDEYFVKPEVWQVMSEAGLTGVTPRPCVQDKTNKPLDKVVQVHVKNVLPEAYVSEAQYRVKCGEEDPLPNVKDLPPCGRIKMSWDSRAPLRFRRSAFKDACDFMKTHEWYGWGAQAYRLVIVSHKVAELILKMTWKGVFLNPIELV
jgi:hypothetical protein